MDLNLTVSYRHRNTGFADIIYFRIVLDRATYTMSELFHEVVMSKVVGTTTPLAQ